MPTTKTSRLRWISPFFFLLIASMAVRSIAQSPWLPVPGNLATPPGMSVQTYSGGVGPLGAAGFSPQQSSIGTGFQAQPDGLTSIPPDTHGAVGPNHVMSISNTHVRIQSRTGTQLEYIPLNTWWGSTDVFDPRVIYDPFTDRFYACAVRASRSAASSILVRVSKTGNPVGATNVPSTWWSLVFDVDATNAVWADFPTIGFNKNWIAVQCNFFSVANNTFVRSHVYPFGKTAALSGTLPAPGFFFNFGTAFGATQQPAVTFDNASEDLYFVNVWNTATGALSVFRMSPSVPPGGNPTMAQVALPAAAPFALRPAVGQDEFCPQSGTTIKLAANDARIQNVVTRNGSIWCTHSVFYPATGTPTRASVQWLELATTNVPPLQVGVIDDPTGAIFYTFPSIAVNKYEDVMINLCSASSTKFSAAAYAFHASSDAPGAMQVCTDTKAGEGIYFKRFAGAVNRWGDYSAACVDPVNDTDFWAVQTYAATPVAPPTTNNNGRWGMWWTKINVDRRAILDNLHINASNFFECEVTGRPGFSYRIDASDTLAAWTNLETGTSPFTFIDEDRANFPLRRYYRAVEVAGGGGGMAPLMAGGGGTESAAFLEDSGLLADGSKAVVVHPAQPVRELPTWQRLAEALPPAARRRALVYWIATLERWIAQDGDLAGTAELYLDMLSSAKAALNAP